MQGVNFQMPKGGQISRAVDTKWAMSSESARNLKALVELARTETGIPVRPGDLDRDPWLLTVENGTLDLRTGRLRAHSRGDLITKSTPVAYDPAAPCPTWESFLDRVFAGDKELIAFIQRAVGYALTGDTREQVLFLASGTGANGKSTFLELLRKLLGDFAQQTPAETLLDRRDGTVPNDVARLRGARFVSCVESDEGKRLSEAMVKRLTGGDTVTARFMRAEYFEFVPVCKIWVATNHRPVVRGGDPAIWRRLLLIPFAVTIPPGERDGELPAKLGSELPGILAWAVRGCLEWQRSGLNVPDRVRATTDGYRDEQDFLGTFINERCVLGDGKTVTVAALYTAYLAWADEAGEEPLGKKLFSMRLADREFQPGRGTGGVRQWRGLTLRTGGGGLWAPL